MAEKTQNYQPLLPFDVTYGEQLTLYDRVPYRKNNEVCNRGNVAMESGNVYKFYRCAVKEPVRIGGT